MKKNLLTFAWIFIVSLSIISCGGDSDTADSTKTNSSESTSKNKSNSLIPGFGKLSEAVNKIQETAEKIEKGELKAEKPVNFRKLKAFLPESVSGLERKSATGESTGAAGFTISKAVGKYQGADKASAQIEIMDAAAAGGLGMMGMAYWSMAEIDKETENGFERTFTFKGGKAYEKYNSKTQRGEINFIAGERMIVTVSGRNISTEQLKAIANAIDTDGLGALKAEEE